MQFSDIIIYHVAFHAKGNITVRKYQLFKLCFAIEKRRLFKVSNILNRRGRQSFSFKYKEARMSIFIDSISAVIDGEIREAIRIVGKQKCRKCLSMD